MSKLTFIQLKPLVCDMHTKGVDKEHFAFTYAGRTLDCIFSLGSNHHELLVGVHVINFGFVVTIVKNKQGEYIAELTDDDYIRFCTAMHLTYKDDGFTSNTLLKLLSKHIPVVSSGRVISYEIMRQYVAYRPVDESEKIYFKGWNDHLKDKNTARNFDKTEFYCGKTVADYCRKNNISSLWTHIPREQIKYHLPWQ